MSEEARKLDDLQEQYSGEFQEPDGDDIPIIDDDLAASINLDRVARRHTEIERIKKLRDEILNRTDEFYAMQIDKLERQIAFFKPALEEYMFGVNAQNAKCKSKKFSAGNLCLRKKPDKIVIDESYVPGEDQNEKYLVAKAVYSIDKTAIKKDLKEHGLLPDYATVEEGEVTFKIEFND